MVAQKWPHRCRRPQASCKQYIQHKGTHCKVPMQSILSLLLPELLHVDFTSIEMTMELDQRPNMMNVLVFCYHFTKHIMAYMMPTQTAKTVAKCMWQGYILIFGVPARLLSDWGANFEINIIKELCELMGILKTRTSLTMLKPTDELNELTKCWYAW